MFFWEELWDILSVFVEDEFIHMYSTTYWLRVSQRKFYFEFETYYLSYSILNWNHLNSRVWKKPIKQDYIWSPKYQV